MADLAALRERAETALELPAEHEARARADTTLILMDWSLDAADVMRVVLPMTDPRHQAHDMLTELLLRWSRVVG